MSKNVTASNQASSSLKQSQPAQKMTRDHASKTALKFALISVLLLAGILLVVDRVVIPRMEDEGLLVSRGWNMDNVRLWKLMEARNHSNPNCPVWSSDLFPVTPQRVKGKRILVMGDSFVWGDGYSNMNTIWWRQLENLLVENGYNDCEVIAAGMCGYQTNDQLRWLKKDIKRFNPDLIIWGYVTNDACERDDRGNKLLHVHKRQERGAIKHVKDVALEVLPNLADTLFSLRNSNRRRIESGKENQFEYGEFELRILQGENFERYKKTIAELGEFARETGIPMFAITLPNGFTYANVKGYNPSRDPDFFQSMRKYYLERYAPVRPLFEKAHILWIDTLDDFIKGASSDPYISKSSSPLRIGINPCNGHPGPFATRFFAEKTFAVLTERYREYLGPQTSRIEPLPAINDCVPISIGLRKVGDFTYEFNYPNKIEEMLQMPMREQHIQLNLQQPAAVSKIIVNGPSLKELTLYGTFEDKKTGYDPQIPEKLLSKKGNQANGIACPILSDRRLSTLKVAARFSGANRQVRVQLVPNESIIN